MNGEKNQNEEKTVRRAVSSRLHLENKKRKNKKQKKNA
jgi:hypothetical protein